MPGGFQFLHIESYARKTDTKGRSVGYVFDEAARVPEACPHVHNPSEPVVVFGDPVDVVRARHDLLVERSECVTKSGKVRRVRVDQHTLMTAVASHPATMQQVRDDPLVRDQVEDWERRTVEWMRFTWGDRLAGVVRHEDEEYPHLHAYVLPDDSQSRARVLHPGAVAKDAVVAEGLATGLDIKAANKLGDLAYRAAMREFQDGYHDAVGISCGLTRLGPRRRRLDRGGWHAERAQAAALGDAIRAADVATEKADALSARAADFVAQARAAAAAAKAAADAADARRCAAQEAERVARRHAASIIREARQEAAEILTEAQARSARLRQFSAVVGGLIGEAMGVTRRLETKAARLVAEARAQSVVDVQAAVAGARCRVDSELAETRAALAAATHRASEAELAVRQVEAQAAVERAGRQSAEAEREIYRDRWAVADNTLQASFRQGHLR